MLEEEDGAAVGGAESGEGVAKGGGGADRVGNTEIRTGSSAAGEAHKAIVLTYSRLERGYLL